MARTARIAILLAVLWPCVPAWTQEDAARPPVLDPTDVIAPFPRNPLSGRAVLSSTRTEILRERNGSSVTVISGKA
ncbi:MAG: hypothetical protein VB859_17770, partial [Planctomycetaceae bacterium]